MAQYLNAHLVSQAARRAGSSEPAAASDGGKRDAHMAAAVYYVEGNVAARIAWWRGDASGRSGTSRIREFVVIAIRGNLRGTQREAEATGAGSSLARRSGSRSRGLCARRVWSGLWSRRVQLRPRPKRCNVPVQPVDCNEFAMLRGSAFATSRESRREMERKVR